MSIEIKVPLLPESISEASVATWYKKVGEAVKRDENLVDLETDKVMLEVPSPTDGVLKEIIKDTGSTVHAQEVIAVIEAASAKESPQTKPATTESKKDEMKPAVTPAFAEKKSSQGSSSASLSPSARRAASQHEVDLSQVTGTGKGGRITRENVLAANSVKQTPSQ